MNVIDNNALAKNIADGITQLQSAGLTLEDHLPGVIQAAVDTELAKLTSSVNDIVATAMKTVEDLKATLDNAVAESTAWRAIIQRINLSS
jgi:hypothetical protein